MRHFKVAFTCLLLLLLLVACHKDDLGISPDRNNTPDTVVPPDYRLPYTGIFDVVETHWEFLVDTSYSNFTDTVNIAYDSSLAIPISAWSYFLMTTQGVGDLTQDYEHEGGPWPVAWTGHFVDTNEFYLRADMDVYPHTWHSIYHGVRH